MMLPEETTETLLPCFFWENCIFVHIYFSGHCMNENQTRCNNICKTGYGKLVVANNNCPFSHFCQCSCPPLNETTCSVKCQEEGKFSDNPDRDSTGCQMCKCKCPLVANCKISCLEYQYEMINNTFGCLECKCLCPEVDCNEQCPGKRGGILGSVNRAGCVTCAGCKEFEASK